MRRIVISIAAMLAFYGIIMLGTPFQQGVFIMMVVACSLFCIVTKIATVKIMIIASIMAASLSFLAIVDMTIIQYLPPPLITGALACIFGRTLISGYVPLITHFSILTGAPMSPEFYRYTRTQTIIWTVTCALLSLEALLLAIFASTEIWSLFAHYVNMVMLILLFLGSHLYSNMRYGVNASPLRTLKAIADPRAWVQ